MQVLKECGGEGLDHSYKKDRMSLIGAIGSILCCSSTEKVECPQDSPKGGQRLRGEAEHFSYNLGKA